MSTKTLIFLGSIIGSTIGGYIPTFFGDSMFSYTSLFTSGIGGIVGIIIAYKLANY